MYLESIYKDDPICRSGSGELFAGDPENARGLDCESTSIGSGIHSSWPHVYDINMELPARDLGFDHEMTLIVLPLGCHGQTSTSG